MTGSAPALEVRDVERAQWLAAGRAARAEGARWFDWLTGIDDGDAVWLVAQARILGAPAGGPGAGGTVRLRARVPDGEPVASLTPVWRGAGWAERETAELFGVTFTGFDDGTGLGLRRLLTSPGQQGLPLRKDFVLGARGVLPWPGGKEPGEATDAPGRRRVQAPGVPWPPEGGR